MSCCGSSPASRCWCSPPSRAPGSAGSDPGRSACRVAAAVCAHDVMACGALSQTSSQRRRRRTGLGRVERGRWPANSSSRCRRRVTSTCLARRMMAKLSNSSSPRFAGMVRLLIVFSGERHDIPSRRRFVPGDHGQAFESCSATAMGEPTGAEPRCILGAKPGRPFVTVSTPREGSAHQTRNDSELRDHRLVEGDHDEARGLIQVFRRPRGREPR